jgi:hypothetical protein
MIKKNHYCLLFLFISASLFAQNKNEDFQVKQQASLNALSFLNLIPEGRENDYGFNSRNDFSKIKIEEPYKCYFLSYKNNELVFIPINQWRVPISVNGNYVALLTVAFNNGNPEVVDFGGKLLANKIQEFEHLFPNQESQHVFIRNTFVKQDYLTHNLSALCTQIDGNDFMKINTKSLEPIYQINEAQPIKTSIIKLNDETIDLISQTKDNK